VPLFYDLLQGQSASPLLNTAIHPKFENQIPDNVFDPASDLSYLRFSNSFVNQTGVYETTLKKRTMFTWKSYGLCFPYYFGTEVVSMPIFA
jgi:hypothetical protein